MSAAESLNGKWRADSFKSARHFPLCLKFVLTQNWGVIGEKKSKNGKKQAFLWVFCPFSGNFRGIATDSDSVIRWFESSYPSHRYHILYKECASEYNIWFLFYMACFPLPQFGERNGETFRIEFCFSPCFSACFARNSGLFCFIFAFSKNWFGETFVSKLPSLPL